MRAIFMDTVGLLASWDSTDQWHAAAMRALDDLGTQVRTVTTTFVMLECGNAASRRRYRPMVDQMRAALETGGKLIAPTEQDWVEPCTAYAHGQAGDAGIVDHVSFTVMRRLGLTDAFTNDRHFRTAGFNTLF